MSKTVALNLLGLVLAVGAYVATWQHNVWGIVIMFAGMLLVEIAKD